METVTCPTCQTANRPEARFCVACGRLLAEAEGDTVPLETGEGAFQLDGATLRVSRDLPRGGGVGLRVGRLTNTGRIRQLNEDNHLTLTWTLTDGVATQPMGLYVVADGMGGHEGGEVASALAVEVIARLATRELAALVVEDRPPDYGAWLARAIQAANAAVYQRGRELHSDMGTTVVAALLAGRDATLANVGDSRAYFLGPEGIEQITRDHSLVETLVAAGQITREEARVHPQANIIYRTVGEEGGVEVDLTVMRLGLGDGLLLCSDGLSGMLSDDQMARIAAQADSPQAACEALVAAANAAGGEDNITAIIARLEHVT